MKDKIRMITVTLMTAFTLTACGGMDGSTVLYGDKDLNGFLDYIDSTVLEKGRTINRNLFYDLLATMLVDKELNKDFAVVEKHTIMFDTVALCYREIGANVGGARKAGEKFE